MSIYNIETEVESTHGTQTWEVVADSPEEALELCKNGKCKFVEEELEVTHLSYPDVSDVYEVKESNASNSKQGEAVQTSHNSTIMKLLNDVRLLLLDVDTPTREQRSNIVHRIAQLSQ